MKVTWLHDNWHLFGYLLLAIIPLGLLLPGTVRKKFLGLSLALGVAAGSYIYLFLFYINTIVFIFKFFQTIKKLTSFIGYK